MLPNFDDQLNLQNNRRTVAARGPCNWQSGDAWAELKNVTITQGNLVANSTGSTTVHEGDDDEWWLEATAPSSLQRAAAHAKALAVVHKTNGTSENYWWEEDIQLH